MPQSDQQRDQVNAYRREWRAKNRDRLAEQRKLRYSETKDDVRDYQRAYYAQNRERLIARAATNRARRADEVRAYARKWTAELRAESPERFLLLSARSRARRKGLTCTLTVGDIVIPTVCPVLGILLERGTVKHHPASPSLDRIDNALGYIPGNVRVISHRANSLKRDMTLQEAQLLVLNWTAR